jgi:hypothetical protein
MPARYGFVMVALSLPLNCNSQNYFKNVFGFRENPADSKARPAGDGILKIEYNQVYELYLYAVFREPSFTIQKMEKSSLFRKEMTVVSTSLDRKYSAPASL